MANQPTKVLAKSFKIALLSHLFASGTFGLVAFGGIHVFGAPILALFGFVFYFPQAILCALLLIVLRQTSKEVNRIFYSMAFVGVFSLFGKLFAQNATDPNWPLAFFLAWTISGLTIAVACLHISSRQVSTSHKV